MQKNLLHEVATPLQLDPGSWGFPLAENNESYKEYTRLLRTYDRTAWSDHVCSRCDKSIMGGDWYKAYVYVSKGPGKKSRVWVEKHHYPDCPDQRKYDEEEMRHEWKKEAKIVQTAAKIAA
jgi:hypothetical protein